MCVISAYVYERGGRGGEETIFQEVPDGTGEKSKPEISKYGGQSNSGTHLKSPCFLGTALFLARAFKCPKGRGPPIHWGLSALLKGN